LIVSRVALPGVIWLWRDRGDAVRIANDAASTRRSMLSSPVLPAMRRAGIGFWPAEVVASAFSESLPWA